MREQVHAEVLVRDLGDELPAQLGEGLSAGPVVAVGKVLRQVDHDVPGQAGVVGAVEAGEHDGDDGDSGLADRGDLVLDQGEGDGSQVVPDVLRGHHLHQAGQLGGELQSEPPVPLVVHLEELLQARQVLAAVSWTEQI